MRPAARALRDDVDDGIAHPIDGAGDGLGIGVEQLGVARRSGDEEGEFWTCTHASLRCV